MKKLVLLAFAALMIVGCNYQNPDGSYDTSKSMAKETAVIDSCEYISAYSKLAHKGNCRFCQERMRQMMWEVQDSILNTMD